MAYKKYIKKGGKSYGPYYYESHREDGKVVNKYVKIPEKLAVSNSQPSFFSGRKFLIFGVAVLLFFTLLLIANNLQKTGNVSLNIETNYLPGESLQGSINFGLAGGEFIPSNSIVVLQLGNFTEEALLSDIVSNPISLGDFSAEGTSLSGSG